MTGCATIPSDLAIELLRSMVATPSESYAEADLAEHLVAVLRGWGFAAERDSAGNVVAEIDRGPGPSVMLLGHMDTAPGAPPVRVVDGRLHGRGAVDAKGPLAAIMCAAAGCDQFRGRLTVVGAVEEETPCSRGAATIMRERPRPDALVVGEPSGVDAVVLGYKGKLDLSYQVRCPEAHPTSPDPKATELAAEAWAALLDVLGPTSHLSFDRPGVTLTALQGDLTAATAQLSVRTPPGFDAQGCADELARRVGQGSVSVVNAVSACRVRRTDPVVRALMAAIRAQGFAPRGKVKTATSDMNTAAEFWDIPMATYGPGDSRLDHREDEHIVIADYLRAIDVLSAALVSLSASLRVRSRAVPAATGADGALG